MKRFILEQSDEEFYSSHSGLALVGLCVNRFARLGKAMKRAIPLRHGISHEDVVKSYLESTYRIRIPDEMATAQAFDSVANIERLYLRRKR